MSKLPAERARAALVQAETLTQLTRRRLARTLTVLRSARQDVRSPLAASARQRVVGASSYAAARAAAFGEQS